VRNTASMDLPARQRGIALLILLAIVGMAVIFALVAGLNKSANDLARARDLKTYAAMAQAKAALIAYAVTYKDTHDNNPNYYVPGYLPCPDQGSGTEGVAAANCGASLVSAVGKLPWKTLGLDALRDGSGECLWYAVSGTYKNSPNGVSGSTTTSNMMNWDTNGQFDVMDTNGTSFLTGATADTNAVAVIFAPGAALSGQNRAPVAGTTNCGGNYTASAYLDTANGINNSTLVTPSSPANVADTSVFIAGTASSAFNDKLVYITRADIWNAIKKRSDFNNYLRAMTRLAAECTATYGQNNNLSFWGDFRLPWASNVSLSGASVPTYAVNASYNDVSSGMYGRLSFKVDTSRGSTSNNISNSISDNGTNGAYLFTNNSYCAYRLEQKIWYDNWKDQLFYAVANNFKPSASWFSTSCGTCLKIGGANYAAVVILAGDKLSGLAQVRSLATDKGSITNYLEPSNTVANTGNSTYQASPASSTFNDIVYAIDQNLNIYCSTAGGAMVTPTTFPTVSPPSNWSPANLADYAACP
jgi:hypothetical protein